MNKQADFEKRFDEKLAKYKVPCTCPKGGMYEPEDRESYACSKCGGSEWVFPDDLVEAFSQELKRERKKEKEKVLKEVNEIWNKAVLEERKIDSLFEALTEAKYKKKYRKGVKKNA